MSAALRERIPDEGLVHCWVRTHEMHDDMKKCMNVYDACGGKYDDKGGWQWRFAEVRRAANAAIPPSFYAKCSSFFTDEMLATVRGSEAAVIERHHLEKCCSE